MCPGPPDLTRSPREELARGLSALRLAAPESVCADIERLINAVLVGSNVRPVNRGGAIPAPEAADLTGLTAALTFIRPKLDRAQAVWDCRPPSVDAQIKLVADEGLDLPSTIAAIAAAAPLLERVGDLDVEGA